MILAEAGIIYRKQRSPQRISSRGLRRFITLILDQICYLIIIIPRIDLYQIISGWYLIPIPSRWMKKVIITCQEKITIHLNKIPRFIFSYEQLTRTFDVLFICLCFTLSCTIVFCIVWWTFLWSAHTHPCEPGGDPRGAICPTSSRSSSGPF